MENSSETIAPNGLKKCPKGAKPPYLGTLLKVFWPESRQALETVLLGAILYGKLDLAQRVPVVHVQVVQDHGLQEEELGGEEFRLPAFDQRRKFRVLLPPQVEDHAWKLETDFFQFQDHVITQGLNRWHDYDIFFLKTCLD